MMEVWKYPLAAEGYPVVMMPKGARILSVNEQRAGYTFVWALVDPKAPQIRHGFRIAGTGHPIVEQDAENYIGTFLMASGTLVWHIFDLGEKP